MRRIRTRQLVCKVLWTKGSLRSGEDRNGGEHREDRWMRQVTRVARALAICQLVVGFVLSAPLSARAASTLALDFVGILEDAFSAELTLGWSFTVNQPIAVTALGFFDDALSPFGTTGLKQDHLVSLWTAGGTLLTQTTITNASTPVASTAADGRWLFNDIPAVILTPGTYVIGALNSASAQCATCDYFRYLDTATTSSAITFIEARENVSGNGFPSTKDSARNAGYFGPDFAFTPVPEPSMGILVGTMGLIGIGGALWRRSRRS